MAFSVINNKQVVAERTTIISAVNYAEECGYNTICFRTSDNKTRTLSRQRGVWVLEAQTA